MIINVFGYILNTDYVKRIYEDCDASGHKPMFYTVINMGIFNKIYIYGKTQTEVFEEIKKQTGEKYENKK